jgi:uncharacterized protein (TIGR02231 family)
MSSLGQVTKVRVFIDRAAVTRTRVIEGAEAREGQIKFAPIPLDADTATFRAHAEIAGGGSPAPLKVTGVSWSVVWADRSSEKQREVKAALERIEADMRALEDAEGAENHLESLLARYAQIATETLSREWLDKDPSFDKWRAAFDHLRKRRAELSIARALRNIARAKLQQRRADRMEEEYRLGRAEKLGYRVAVALDPAGLAAHAGKKGTLRVELTYITPNAQWMPIYDARHYAASSGTAERITLTGIALVRQSTGEDWKDIELVATTARPPLSEPPPELARLIIVGHQGTEARELVSATRAVERLTGAPSRAPQAEVEATVEHIAPGTVSIPSTQRPVRIELFSSELPCRSKLEVAPMDRPVAILVAELENRTQRVLLPGKMNVFRGPNYSGQARLGFVTPNERFRVPLGTDATLRIKREVSSRPEKKATITGAVTHTFESRTVLENLGNAPIEVLVRDRVPVSRAEEAEVRIVEIDRAMEIHAETGLGLLPLTVSPHSKREVTLAFKVTAPRGFTIQPPSTY